MALFDIKKSVERTIKIGNYTFNRIFLEDKELFNEYLSNKSYEQVGWNHAFAVIYPMSLSEKNEIIVWKLINDYLCTFTYNFRSKRLGLYLQPISKDGKGEHKVLWKNISKILESANGKESAKLLLLPVGEHNLLSTEKTEGVNLIKENPDFIFRCEDLIKLEGKKYKNRRNMVNGFKKNYPNHEIRFGSVEDIDGVLKVRNKWVGDRFTDKKKPWDESFFKMLLENLPEIDARLVVIEVEKEIQGYFIISKLCNNCSAIITQNTNLDFKGMTEYLWYESLRLNSDLGEFENDGNGGSSKDGLYKYKMDHCPVTLVEKNSFIIKDGDMSKIIKE